MIPLLSKTLQILAYPFFILLHILFITSSLVLRIYQTFSAPITNNEQTDQIENENASEIKINPPKHLALILVPSKKRRNGEKYALIQSILSSVEWSLDNGIEELSIWDGQGLIQSILPNLMKTLSTSNQTSTSKQNNFPPSPPDSKPSTPPNGTQNDIHDENEDEDDLTPTSPSPQRKQGKSLVDRLENLGNEIRSMIVYSNDNQSSPIGTSNKGLKIYFLPPSCSEELILNLTKKYIEKNKEINDINVKSINKDIKDQLHFNSDPDLLLIHQLSPESFWKSLLPRKAPELWGYPFWSLRITEIYQYPSPLPLLHHLNPLLNSLRSSSLPFLRKLGYSISLPTKLDSKGILNKEEWDGLMIAWSKVEQRLGK